jgi:phage internal scaffolding protein
MKKPWIYDGKLHTIRPDGNLDISTINDEPSLTQQQFKDECDINNIIRNYTQTGELPLSNRVGQFLDVSHITDYQTALHTVMEAEQAFLQIPANIRTRFENSPQQLVDFLYDSKNKDEAIKLGLIPQTQNANTQNSNQQNANTQTKEAPSTSSPS